MNEYFNGSCDLPLRILSPKFGQTGNVKLLTVNICKPEEDWYGQPKYCYEKTIHFVLIDQLCCRLWTSRFWVGTLSGVIKVYQEYI